MVVVMAQDLMQKRGSIGKPTLMEKGGHRKRGSHSLGVQTQRTQHKWTDWEHEGRNLIFNLHFHGIQI